MTGFEPATAGATVERSDVDDVGSFPELTVFRPVCHWLIRPSRFEAAGFLRNVSRIFQEYAARASRLNSNCGQLLRENTLRLMRREVRRKEGLAVDEEDLAQVQHDMLSVEAREVIGPMKIRRQRSTPSVKKRREGCRHGSCGEAPRSYRIAPADEIQRLGARFEL